MAKHPITRRFEIDAGHRLVGHESKCRNVHGHRYVFELTVSERKGLDKVGRVIDFSEVKRLVGGWLDNHWDHGMIVEKTDPLLLPFKDAKVKLFVVDFSPTAENLAQFFFEQCVRLLSAFDVEKVRVYETPNCWADYSG